MSKVKGVHRLLQAVLLILFGVLILWKRTGFFNLIIFIVSLVVAAGGVAQIVSFFTAKERKSRQLVLAALYIALGGFMFFFPALPRYALAILFACYVLMNGVIKAFDCFFSIRNKAGELLYSLFPALFYLTFGFILLFSPLYHFQAVLIIIGIYCLLLGATYGADFVRMMIPSRTKQKLKRRVRITLPIFLAAFIPHTVLTKLNRFLASGEQRKPGDFEDLDDKKDAAPPDLEVFIHVANDGFCAIGHADICFDGELVAYGNYHEAVSTPIGTGPGVLLICNKEQYIPFCLKFNKTTIFSFGLRLNEEQKAAVRERIRQIKSNTYEWFTPYQEAARENPDVDISQFTDFPSGLAHVADVHFYKFHSGRYKTYFVMSTNCIMLAEDIVCRAGTDILNINGILSPGTFYDYLEAEFLKKGSMVISREVYTLDTVHALLQKQAQEAAAPPEPLP